MISEVRAVGEELGIASELVWRQPFPGPDLAIRCLGEITEEKLEIIRESDYILRDEIALAGLEREIWHFYRTSKHSQRGRNGGLQNL